MIQLLLKVLETHPEQTGNMPFHHIDARYSPGISDIGRFQFRKVFLLLGYVLRAWWLRLTGRVDTLYFMPANASRVPVYRDWLILGLCRPFFRHTIFHWQAYGLGAWLEDEARPWERWISRRIYGRPDLSIVLREFNRHDADAVRSRRTVVIPNAIDDPCPEFPTAMKPRLEARQRLRQSMAGQSPPSRQDVSKAGDDPHTFKLLYIGLCHPEKGLFDAVDGVRIAGARLKGTGLGIHLTVAGTFWKDQDQARFETMIQHPDLTNDSPVRVTYAGYAGGDKKWGLFKESDALIFPTYYNAESFGIVLVEGMAFGLSLIASRWRGLDDLLPENHPGIVDPKQPDQIADAILAALKRPYDPSIRDHFLQHYTSSVFAEKIIHALQRVEP